MDTESKHIECIHCENMWNGKCSEEQRHNKPDKCLAYKENRW